MNNMDAKGGIGLLTLFCLSIGTIIGVGWITLLGTWLGAAGSIGAILAFALGGAIILAIVFCYGEALSITGATGGEIAFARAAGGRRAAMCAGWILLLVFLGVVAFEAISVAWIAGILFPSVLGPPLYSILGADVHLGALLIGVGGTLIIALFHLRGNQWIEKLQNFSTITKLIAALIFISAGLAFGDPANLEPGFVRREGAIDMAGFLSVLSMTPLFYAGFNTTLQAVDERDASVSLRGVGLVLVSSILGAILFYAGVIASAAMSAPRELLLTADLPAAAAFDHAFSSSLMSKLVLISGLLGLVSAWNATFFAATRVLAVLAEDGVIGSWFGRRSTATGSYVNATIFCAILASLGAICGRNAVGPIVATSALGLVAMFAIAAGSAIRLRRLQPETLRSFKIPGGAKTAWLALALSIGLMVIALGNAVAQAGGFPIELALMTVWAILGVAVAARGAAVPARAGD